MNKAEIVEFVAEQADISKKTAGEALSAVLAGITESLKKGEGVSFVGFGTFSISHRAARQGRNPRTGGYISIPATNNVKFKAGKGLKDTVNS